MVCIEKVCAGVNHNTKDFVQKINGEHRCKSLTSKRTNLSSLHNQMISHFLIHSLFSLRRFIYSAFFLSSTSCWCTGFGKKHQCWSNIVLPFSALCCMPWLINLKLLLHLGILLVTLRQNWMKLFYMTYQILLRVTIRAVCR